MYKVYFGIDESVNRWLDGVYTWLQACKRKQQLLRWYPYVDIYAVA